MDDPSQAVAAMTSTWNLRVGRRVDAPPGAVSEARAALDDPEVAWWLSALLDPTTLARRPRDTPSWSGLEPVAGLARAALWAHHLRPAGDALHEAVPTALRALRGQLRSWPAASFPILSAGRADEVFDADVHALVAALGVPIVGWNTPGAGRSLVRYAGPQHGIAWMEIAPDLSADLPRLDVLAGALRSPRTMPWRHGLRALRWVMSAEADAFLEPCNLAFGQRAADPRASAPETVARIAERYGLAEDAAATWLMMHVLPVCTDAAIREVTGWPAATVASAHKELLANHLVVEDTRSRTRRRVFLPGPWADLAAPTAPQERARLDLLGVVFPEGERRPPLWPGLWAREPLGTLYARIAEI